MRLLRSDQRSRQAQETAQSGEGGFSARSRALNVTHSRTREVVRSVDVTGRSDREVEKIMRGMLRNISDEYFIDDCPPRPAPLQWRA